MLMPSEEMKAFIASLRVGEEINASMWIPSFSAFPAIHSIKEEPFRLLTAHNEISSVSRALHY